jgi:hypothetical protein
VFPKLSRVLQVKMETSSWSCREGTILVSDVRGWAAAWLISILVEGRKDL